MLFKTHTSNIPQIRATIATHGGCYFHGSGDMYALDANGNSEESNFRKDYSNDTNEESRYRKKFMRGDKLPKTVEELNKMLMDSRNQEIMAVRNITDSAAKIKTVTVEEADFQDGDAEIDYSKYDRREK